MNICNMRFEKDLKPKAQAEKRIPFFLHGGGDIRMTRIRPDWDDLWITVGITVAPDPFNQSHGKYLRLGCAWLASLTPRHLTVI